MTSGSIQANWSQPAAYEAYAGRWSRPVARQFVDWLAIPPGKEWLDVGCGTGALSEAILASAQPRSLTAIDQSENFVNHAMATIKDPRARFRIGDAQALPVGDLSHDVIVSGLVFNFVPDRPLMFTEMRRTVRRGGWLALYVWDYAGEMQMMRRFWNAAAALSPVAKAYDEGVRFAFCKPAPLTTLFREAGLVDIECRVIDVPTVFKNFDDYWNPFLGGQGPAPIYCLALSDERRAQLRERLRATLPAELDGSIRLIARAFAVRGRRT